MRSKRYAYFGTKRTNSHELFRQLLSPSGHSRSLFELSQIPAAQLLDFPPGLGAGGTASAQKRATVIDEVSKQLADSSFLNERGKPYAAKSIATC